MENSRIVEASMDNRERTQLKTYIPYGNRTRVSAVKRRCPRPLDERD